MEKKQTSIGQVEIALTYHRHTGPRIEHSSVKLGFDSARSYSFSSSVIWPENDNYEKHIQAGVEEALIEKQGSLEMTEIKLLAIEINEIESTPRGFQSAAYAATRAAFLV